MCDEDKRPDWPYEFSKKTARWLIDHNVKEIHHITTESPIGNKRYYLKLIAEDGGSQVVDVYFFSCNTEFVIQPGMDKLVYITISSKVREVLAADKRWEEQNERDLKEYERLKKKFQRQMF